MNKLHVLGNVYSSNTDAFNQLCEQLESDGYIIGYQDGTLQAIIMTEETPNDSEE